MLIAASLVLLMTPALALFYGGMSRQKSVLNMMMMSFGAMGVVGVIYLLWGWSMSYGSESVLGLFANPFEMFGLSGVIGDATEWAVSGSGAYPQVVDVAFQVTFAIITVALISGAIAERARFGTWLAFVGVWVTLAYFPLAHMVWGGGLLSHSDSGLAAMIFGTVDDGEGGLTAAVAPVDFAGGTVVHINAGMAALVLVLLIGKRLEFGRTAYRPHNLPLVMLGAALLWFGWFGFNAGSAFGANGAAGLAWVNTTAATAAAMLGWLLAERIRDGHATSLGAASGVVAGLVAITPAAGSVHPLGAIALGAIAGVLSALAVGLKHRFGYDDALDVVGVHLVAGLWGTIAIGLFATGTFGTDAGMFYSADGWRLLVVQIVIAVAALVFTAIMTAIAWAICRPLGWRIDKADEQAGIDGAQHAESAYEASTNALIR
ncbi:MULTISPECIES: ammonium transporter [Dietzia]|uniref:Ammonium transporter n=1 Tax=Dietzia maris TaxID=37915 RepID=A0A365P9D8_9ACTN|nr:MULTISPECIES: ammonium transporter [Dietzia]MBB0991996.1 ammonium transporter [Dietzia sp. SLG510A3-30A2]MBB1008625.1 ammonium transporter [Dietzia sp. SLG510A3-3B2-2]OAV77362.1 ammonium transporter [Dietzia sp. 111N12-1]ODQ87252.1 ammonium transporter [Dietzia alimentaria]RBA35292.1 ammonium transporter [Dietzia maris]